VAHSAPKCGVAPASVLGLAAFFALFGIRASSFGAEACFTARVKQRVKNRVKHKVKKDFTRLHPKRQRNVSEMQRFVPMSSLETLLRDPGP
jgi:hypothetical protein